MNQRKRELLDRKRRLEFEISLIDQSLENIVDQEKRQRLENQQTYEKKLKSLL